MQRIPKKFFTEKEYLEFERNSDTKHEFYKGEIFDLAGASYNHGIINFNITGILHKKLSKNCKAISSDLKVFIKSNTLFTYPDISIICDKTEFLDNKKDTITNPKVIFEILSPSTEDYDKNQKFELYKGLNSLEEYILIYQNEFKTESFFKSENWQKTGYEGLGADLKIKSLGLELRLKEIYDGIEIK
ncbi:MAG TPA: Uma2 family endonuclease [Ignavibacteria bacterium]|nr:Uma2 family endonuclease [Ignavibacteria bacterium]